RVATSSSSVYLNPTVSVLASLSVSSFNASVPAKVYTLSLHDALPISPPSTCPSGWNCGDIGTPALAGSQSLSGGSWTIQGGGNDIWGMADQFHFVSQALAANGRVSARVVSQTNTTGWAKAGVMLRQSS